jgi:ATP-dependent Clp protease ATP-binding subunit ClpC
MEVNMTISDSAMDLIIDKGYDKAYGARPLKRVIQRYIEDKLSEEILRGNLKAGGNIIVDAIDGEFVFTQE